MATWNRIASAAALTLLLLAPAGAGADSAAPRDYVAAVNGTTVVVSADAYAGLDAPGRPCPDQGLIRRDVASGAAVLVTTCDAGHRFVDECVPPGAYQYGLLEPIACGGAIAYAAWYAAVTTTAPVAGCQRTVAAPAPFTGQVPWGGERTRCAYSSATGCGQLGGAPAGVLAFDGAALLLGLALWRRRSRHERARPAP